MDVFGTDTRIARKQNSPRQIQTFGVIKLTRIANEMLILPIVLNETDGKRL